MTATRVAIDGVDVTRAIRTPEIDRAAAVVARLPTVRAVLVDRQRQMGETAAIVMEGRDIGTVVFPGADVKIYLDAAPEERARRRAIDPAHTPACRRRCRRSPRCSPSAIDCDSTRAASPLYAAADAIIVDTTGKSVQEVVGKVMVIIRRKCEV